MIIHGFLDGDLHEYLISFDGIKLMFVSPKNTNRKLADDLIELLHGLQNERDEGIIILLIKVNFLILLGFY